MKPLKPLTIVLVALCLLLGCLLSGCSGEEPQGKQDSGPREKVDGESVSVDVNSLAPAFAARTLDGSQASLRDYVGNNVILLEFWSIFCKSCIEEMPHIMELHNRYGDKGLAVLSINTDIFSDARIYKALEKAGVVFEYPVLRDTRQQIVKDYNVEVLPVTVIIDRSGWIRLYQEGYRPGDEKTFANTIERLLSDEGSEEIILASKEGKTAFAPDSVELVQPGKRLGQPLSLESLSGKKVTIGDGSSTVLFFWSLYCRPCREEFPHMYELAEKYPKDKLQIVSVNVDNRRLAGRVEKFVAPYPEMECIPDWPGQSDTTLANMLGVGVTPTMIVFDAAGKVLYTGEGKIEPAKIGQILDETLK